MCSVFENWQLCSHSQKLGRISVRYYPFTTLISLTNSQCSSDTLHWVSLSPQCTGSNRTIVRVGAWTGTLSGSEGKLLHVEEEIYFPYLISLWTFSGVSDSPTWVHYQSARLPQDTPPKSYNPPSSQPTTVSVLTEQPQIFEIWDLLFLFFVLQVTYDLILYTCVVNLHDIMSLIHHFLRFIATLSSAQNGARYNHVS